MPEMTAPERTRLQYIGGHSWRTDTMGDAKPGVESVRADLLEASQREVERLSEVEGEYHMALANVDALVSVNTRLRREVGRLRESLTVTKGWKDEAVTARDETRAREARLREVVTEMRRLHDEEWHEQALQDDPEFDVHAPDAICDCAPCVMAECFFRDEARAALSNDSQQPTGENHA